MVSKELAANRKLISMEAIEEAMQNVKGAVMMAYPMGLPEWDPIRQALENDEDLAGQEASKSVLDAESCIMWFAGKSMARDQVESRTALVLHTHDAFVLLLLLLLLFSKVKILLVNEPCVPCLLVWRRSHSPSTSGGTTSAWSR